MPTLPLANATTHRPGETAALPRRAACPGCRQASRRLLGWWGAGLLLAAAIPAIPAAGAAEPRWLGGETTIAATGPGLALQATTTPAALGVAANGADALVAFSAAGSPWVVRLAPEGGQEPRPLDPPAAARGTNAVLTPGGASLVTWIAETKLRARRLAANDSLSPLLVLADEAPAAETQGAAVVPRADGDLVVASLRRVYGEPAAGDTSRGFWRETVVVRRYSRLGRPRGQSVLLSPVATSCDIATFCGQASWGTPRLAARAGFGAGEPPTSDPALLAVWQYSFQGGRPLFAGGNLDIYARPLDHDGNPVGEVVRVNGFDQAGMSSPEVAALPGGGFVVVWVSSPNRANLDRIAEQDGDGSGIVMRFVSAAGIPLGQEVIVNTTTAGDQWQPAVAVGADGSVFVVWQDSADTVRGQRFASDGQRVGSELVLNTAGPEVMAPSVTALANDSWLVSWQRRRYDDQSQPVFTLVTQRLSFAPAPSTLVVNAPPQLLTSEEGAETAFTIQLASPPADRVTVPLAASIAGEVAITPDRVELDPATWDQPQTVTVTGLDDGVLDGDRPLAITFGPLISEDPTFADALPGDLRLRNDEPSCRLEVFQPQQNQALTVGRPATVYWRFGGGACSDQVTLSLLRSGESIAALGDFSNEVDANGGVVAQVAIPANAPTGDGFQIRVSTTGNPAFSAVSPVFSLRRQVCRLELLQPDGGERWQRGSRRPVLWSSTGGGCGPSVQLTLLRGDQPVLELATTANDGRFAWTIPATLPRAADYRMRIRSLAQPDLGDTSQGTFAIVGGSSAVALSRPTTVRQP